MQRLKRVIAIDIETSPDCGGKLRVIACIEDPPLIRHILAYIKRRGALINRVARAAGFTAGRHHNLIAWVTAQGSLRPGPEIHPITVRYARGQTLVQYLSQRIHQISATCPWTEEPRKYLPQSRETLVIVPIRRPCRSQSTRF